MHIVDTTLFYAPASGGVKRYLMAKRRFLAAQKGVRHTLVVPGRSDAKPASGIVTLAAPRIPFGHGYRCPVAIGNWARALCALEPDLIEAGDPYQVAWAALSAARRLEIPAVAFVHSDFQRIAALHAGETAAALAAVYERNLYARFSLVTTAGRHLAARMRDLGIRRVAVQPLGVDTAVFHPQRRDPRLKAQLGLPANVRLLIYAGRLSAEKQIPRLLEMARLLGPAYHLLIVGGETVCRLSPNATQLPFVQDCAQLARLLASADALVHAGEHETFGLVFLEAMASGLPVVGVHAGAAPEIVSPAVGRLARPGGAAYLADAVTQLFDGDVAAMGVMARRTVEQQYAWEPLFRRQLARYARLVRTSAARPSLTPAGAMQ